MVLTAFLPSATRIPVSQNQAGARGQGTPLVQSVRVSPRALNKEEQEGGSGAKGSCLVQAFSGGSLQALLPKTKGN